MFQHPRYKLEKKIGEGGENIVYLATDIQENKSVVIKRGKHSLNIKNRLKWDQEANLLKQLHMPNIVSYIDAFVGTVKLAEYGYLVQEFIAGKSLKEEYLEIRYTQDQVHDIIEEILEILVDLQELTPPVIHRDLKPANIMRRTASGKLVLIDFGLAIDHRDSDLGHTMAAGTLGYQSPEQISGFPSPASDVYSVGVIAVELLSRRPPSELLWGQKLKWESSVFSVKKSWKQWLSQALSNEEERFPTAQSALIALRTSRSGGSNLPPPKKATPDPSPSIQEPKPVRATARKPTSLGEALFKTKQSVTNRNLGNSPKEEGQRLHSQLQGYKFACIFFFFVWSVMSIGAAIYFSHLQKEIKAGRLEHPRIVTNIMGRWGLLIGFAPWIMMFLSTLFAIFV